MSNFSLNALFAVLAGVCWAIGSFAAKFWMKQVDIHPTLSFAIRETVTFFGVWIIILPVAMKQIPELLSLREGRLAILALAVFSGLIGSLIGHILLFYALKSPELDLSLVMALAYTSPVWGTALALLFGQEVFSWQKVLGIGVTLLGMFIALTAK